MKPTSEKKEAEPPSVPVAISRFAGAHLGACALAITYIAAAARGVSAPAALQRAFWAWVAATLFGRVLGFILGKNLLPRRPAPPLPAEAEGGT